MGPEGVKVCLESGANDLGGTLMDETITRSAGAVHGQEMTPARMEAIIRSIGRIPVNERLCTGMRRRSDTPRRSPLDPTRCRRSSALRS